tara:strand:- start:69 stop:413 length:345 start_codon:yes stop_codon:yes gene_type:complete
MRTKGVGPQGLGIPNASPLKQTDNPPKRGTPHTGRNNVSQGLKANKKKYADVVDYKGKSQFTKPGALFFNSGTRRAHGMGGTMDKIWEGAKNAVIPGRFMGKMLKAYKLKKGQN